LFQFADLLSEADLFQEVLHHFELELSQLFQLEFHHFHQLFPQFHQLHHHFSQLFPDEFAANNLF
jgi:hypothetical protein